ncbi:MAG: hypothetical protein IJX14_10985, partial [Clostridia bacterium]|nr:hypothetical protein [Clostridia bacterium]
MSLFNNIRSGTTVRIPSGVHHISSPIVIRGKNIRILGEDGAVLRGTIRLHRNDFTETEPGVLAAAVSSPVDAVYIGNRKYTMAR